jgi:hypothetical protein
MLNQGILRKEGKLRIFENSVMKKIGNNKKDVT